MSAKEIPEWVPGAVKSMAMAIPVGEVSQRLLTDNRMEKVWGRLRKRKVKAKVIDSLDTWGIRERHFSIDERACALLFAHVVSELSSPRSMWTRRNAKEWATKWNEAALLCRWISQDPMFQADKEFARAARIVAVGLEKHAGLLKEQGRVVDLGQNDAPYIIGRRSRARGSDKNRGSVRAIATITQALFGSFLYDTVAKIATVALQPKSDISERSVRNWCSDLPPAATRQ